MLGIEMMDKTSGNDGGAIINISSMSGDHEYIILLFGLFLLSYVLYCIFRAYPR